MDVKHYALKITQSTRIVGFFVFDSLDAAELMKTYIETNEVLEKNLIFDIGPIARKIVEYLKCEILSFSDVQRHQRDYELIASN